MSIETGSIAAININVVSGTASAFSCDRTNQGLTSMGRDQKSQALKAEKTDIIIAPDHGQ